MAVVPSALSVPFDLTVDVHEIPGGGYFGEVRQLPGCLAQADNLKDLAEAIRDFADILCVAGVLDPSGQTPSSAASSSSRTTQ